MPDKIRSTPLVTVYIPTKNRPELLQRALQSVLNQDYSSIEIIIVDDGSSPDNQTKAKVIAGQSDNIRIILNAESKGACHARNQAIAEAKGEFITGLDDDDEFLPDRISTFVSAWPKYPSISALCSGYLFILPGGRRLSSGNRRLRINSHQIKFKNDVGNQIFTKTNWLRQIGGFDPALVACQDYDVWLRLTCQKGDIVRIANQSYVVHQEHEYPRISQFERRITGHEALIVKHQAHFTAEQMRSQQFYCALYGGEKSIVKLFRMAGARNMVTLIKMLLVRSLTKVRL